MQQFFILYTIIYRLDTLMGIVYDPHHIHSIDLYRSFGLCDLVMNNTIRMAVLCHHALQRQVGKVLAERLLLDTQLLC